MRVLSPAIGVWVFNGIMVILGFLTACEQAANNQQQHCQTDNLVWAIGNAGDALLSAGFWTATATIAIAAFTWMLKRSTDKLWSAGERQLRIGQASVDAAVVSYQVIAANAERQLRAYVTAAGGDIAPHRNPTQMGAIGPIEGRPHTYGISVLLKNGGQTPAVNVKINVVLQKLITDIPTDFGFPDSDTFGYGVIGPGGEMQTPAIHIEANKLEAVEAGKEWYFLGVGRI